jgi:hypothetical protein
VNVADLHPRRHEPPAGWDATTFDTLTTALAMALVAAFERTREAVGVTTSAQLRPPRRPRKGRLGAVLREPKDTAMGGVRGARPAGAAQSEPVIEAAK